VLLLAIHLIAGLLAGWLGWQIGQRILARQHMIVQHNKSALEGEL
jgi:hypothetical protein